MVEWSEATQEEFDELPAANRRPEDVAWDRLLAALAQGKLVRIPFVDEADRKRKRLALGRRATNRGLKLEVRVGEGVMVARAVREPKAARRQSQDAG